MRRSVATAVVVALMTAIVAPTSAVASGPGKVAVLHATIDTSAWASPATDPIGIDWWAAKGRLLMTDSEVEERVCPDGQGYDADPVENCSFASTITYYQGINTFELSSSGTILRTSDTACVAPFDTCTGYSIEPTDVAAEGTNVYVTDDNQDRVFVIDVGGDGELNTSDDVRTSFSTRAFNDYDPEGVDFDPTTGTLLVTSGVFNQVYRIGPGQNGVFDGTDDVVSCMDTSRLGMRDPEDVAVDPATGRIYVASQVTDREIAVATPDGQLVDLIDTSTVLPWSTTAISVGGIALAPSSDDPGRNDLFLAARGLDNNSSVLPGGNDGKIYEIRLDDPPTSRAPVVSTPGNQINVEGESIRLQVVAHDPNGDALTYSIAPQEGTVLSQLPPGLSLDPQTGLISGTIAPGAAGAGNRPDGAYRVRILVSDGTTTTLRDITSWTIHPDAAAFQTATGTAFNTSPTITDPGDRTSTEGDAVDLQLLASDPDVGVSSQRLMFTATGLPPGVHLDCLSGALTGTIAAGAAATGPYRTRVMVEDQTTPESTSFRSKWDAATFTWNVDPAIPPNEAPLLTNPGARTNLEGDAVSLQVVANDPNGDPLTYSATGLPPGLTIDAGTGLISGTITPGPGADGAPYAASVSVSDGSLSATQSFTWSVDARIRFRSSTAAGLNKAARSITVARPAGVVAGDLLVAAIDFNGNPASITAPAGWVLRGSNASGSLFKQFVYTKVAGSEPISYTFSFPSSLSAGAVIAAYSGVSTTSPVATFAGQSNAPSTTIAAPSVSALAGQMLVGIFGAPSNATVTPPTGMIERHELITPGAQKTVTAVADDHLASTGATGVRVAATTLTPKKSAVSVGQVLVLNPA